MPLPMNRRTFIRTLSLTGAGVALGSLSPRLFGRVRGANDRIRIGLVGFADRARQALLPAFYLHAKELNCEIVAVSDIWKRRREEAVVFFKKNFQQDVTTYRNNEEMYAAAD